MNKLTRYQICNQIWDEPKNKLWDKLDKTLPSNLWCKIYWELDNKIRNRIYFKIRGI